MIKDELDIHRTIRYKQRNKYDEDLINIKPNQSIFVLDFKNFFLWDEEGHLLIVTEFKKPDNNKETKILDHFFLMPKDYNLGKINFIVESYLKLKRSEQNIIWSDNCTKEFKNNQLLEFYSRITSEKIFVNFLNLIMHTILVTLKLELLIIIH